ncbi:hypothetical protein PoB_000873800 [Plakobranchus ocellatus]|uniref:Uncharacterized protein n=1 Tax=Plakobranchus ocellatus TaxID=259542 RepID=A0AAV3YI92_9GAST|nr:hypothetical protein PoB_000873800 [Plakobranchus ocellatus]
MYCGFSAHSESKPRRVVPVPPKDAAVPGRVGPPLMVHEWVATNTPTRQGHKVHSPPSTTTGHPLDSCRHSRRFFQIWGVVGSSRPGSMFTCGCRPQQFLHTRYHPGGMPPE